ncbi:hypothetical protein [Carboxylicivirga sp. N1Y90]|uniref:hypothetical protein n=1 Tax=Carboxylicivirga fragile TaxID=3417571 RepID=UPI003D32B9D7|nr:hypothetical protein [Marinilabiliaceae bacterium N1Y90]
MNYIKLILLLISIAMASCNTKEKSSGSTQDKTVVQANDQIEFIREKYALIERKMASQTYSLIELVNESDAGVITYKRAMDGENIMYAFSSDCDDHGCSQSSYYFWDNKLIFKFDQSSSWVGQSDKISEKRTYYLNETEILCLQRTKTGSGGYDAVNHLLSKVPHDTLKSNSVFDRSSIKAILEFTNDEFKELAIVKKVEDAGYPMFNVTFYFIDRNETETIYLSSEGITSSHPLSALIGKTVMVTYLKKELTNMKRLYGATDEVGEINPEWKRLKGIVQKIEGGSVGDLPDQVTIEAKDGSKIVFDYYIDADMMAYSNKPVTVYYTTSETKDLSSLKLMEEMSATDSEVDTNMETSEYVRNWIYAENDKFIIKVDRFEDRTLRYTSWNKPKEISDSPDLILTGGEVVQQGTGGGYHYIFKNNDWTYTVMDVWMAEQDEDMGIFLYLSNNGEKKLHTKLNNLKIKDSDVQQSSEETTKTKSHYICYKEDTDANTYIWIRFSNGKAKEIKYKGMASTMELVFVKKSENLNPDGSYPVYADYYNEIVDGKVNGVYKLTHSGNYDYAEYIRANDSKTFNFTIDHNANPYGSSPCF